MKSPPILFRFVFREDPQQVAVVKIQRPKPCDFAGLFQAAEQANPYDLTGRFGRFLFSSCLRQNPSADLFNRIVLTEIPYQPYKAFFARRPHRNILADLELIAFLPQIIEKLPFGHRLPNRLVHVGANQPPPSGALFLLGTPFAVLLGFPVLRIFNHR